MLDNFNIDGHKILFFGLIQQERVRQISLHKIYDNCHYSICQINITKHPKRGGY